jgi:hypothetical protein
MKRKHGPDVNWRSAPVDVEAVYVAGGGAPHGRYVEILYFKIVINYRQIIIPLFL